MKKLLCSPSTFYIEQFLNDIVLRLSKVIVGKFKELKSSNIIYSSCGSSELENGLILLNDNDLSFNLFSLLNLKLGQCRCEFLVSETASPVISSCSIKGNVECSVNYKLLRFTSFMFRVFKVKNLRAGKDFTF